MSEIGLYIHIPYCREICPYCDFVKKRGRDGVPDNFVDAIIQEMNRFEGPKNVSSVFFGGGTPSMLSLEQFARIMENLSDNFTLRDSETSLEANPDDINAEKASGWHDLGVNRLIVGAQSFDDESLRFLGRNHDRRSALDACEVVRSEFENWGLDLIFGAMTNEQWENGGLTRFESDLETCANLRPQHVSTYALTYEEGTPLWRRRDAALDEDMSLELYRAAHTGLSDYNHYEISNFAREGYLSKHNGVYWRNGEYIGFGPGAYSYIDGVRARNDYKVDQYLRDPGRRCEVLNLSAEEIRVETLIQHFRTRQGIRFDDYQRRFGSSLDGDFAVELKALRDRGLISDENGALRPTALGFELNNEIGMVLVS